MPAPGCAIVIALEGISGAGKSSVAARAAAAFGWVPLAEAYDRLDPRPGLDPRSPRALAALETVLLREEARRWSAARSLVEDGATVVADTGFLGPLSYTAALAELGAAPPALVRRLSARARGLVARGAWGLPDAVVYLETSGAVRARRVRRDPLRHPPALAARHEAAGRIERRYLLERLPAALPGRVRRVNADRPLGAVVAAVGRSVGPLGPLRAPRAAARRALGLLASDPRAAPAASATVKKTPLSAVAPHR